MPCVQETTFWFLKKELNLAHKIQQSILPKEFNIHPQCETRAIMVPAKEIGGDFYDFLKLDSKHFAFCRR